MTTTRTITLELPDQLSATSHEWIDVLLTATSKARSAGDFASAEIISRLAMLVTIAANYSAPITVGYPR